LSLSKIIKYLFVITSVVILVTCGGGSGATLPKKSIAVLVGVWQTSCIPTSQFTSLLSKASFTLKQETIYQTLFENKTCSGTGQTTVSTINYTIGDVITTSSGLKAYQIDLFSEINSFVQFNIFRVEGNILYFGIGSTTVDTRPNSLDFNSPATRVN